MGNIDVEAQPPFDEAPDVFDTDLAPTALPHTGGDVTISASATDDRAISEVYAVITAPGGDETVLPLDGVSASRYSGTWTAPSNATPDDLVYAVQVSALDDIGQQDTEDAGDVTVAAESSDNEPPVLSDFFATPSILGYEGGSVELEVKAIDPDGIDTVGATVHLAGGDDLDVPLSVEDPSSPDTYSGEVDIPGNATDHSLTHTVELAARDARGAEASEIMGEIIVWPEVLDEESPHVFDPDLDPGTLPASGGLVSMSVSATDNVGVTQVQAKVYDANGIVDYFDLLGESATRYVRHVVGPGQRHAPRTRSTTSTSRRTTRSGQQRLRERRLQRRRDATGRLEVDAVEETVVVRAGAGREGGAAVGGAAQRRGDGGRVHRAVAGAAVPAAGWAGPGADAGAGEGEAGRRAVPGRGGWAALVEAAGGAG